MFALRIHVIENNLEAVIFDVDGTLAETERHGHRVAFNQAFEKLGLDDRWDENLYGRLLKVTGGVRRLKHYFIDYKGLTEREAADLAVQIHPIKTEMFLRVVREDKIPPRPGLLRFLKELSDDELRLAVATTGTTEWVGPLLEMVCTRGGIEPFEVVVTGDDVKERKPDPEAFHLALDRLGLSQQQVVIIEDSRNGVAAAKASKCICVAVQGDYALVDELKEADLIVDNFGEPEAPLEVLSNPWSVKVDAGLTPLVMRELQAKVQATTSS